MKWGISVCTVAMRIAVVLICGCANVPMGKTPVADFGTPKMPSRRRTGLPIRMAILPPIPGRLVFLSLWSVTGWSIISRQTR